MKLTIDNLDGLGAVDYSEAVDRSAPLRVERTLNAPSIARGLLCLEGSGLAVPVRRGRVVMSSDAGRVLFTGYLATEPVAEYAGVASEGAVYRLGWSAVSDEWLLDKQAWGSTPGVALGDKGSDVLRSLVSRLGSGVGTTAPELERSVGVFVPEADASWSGHAGAAAGSAYGAYRVLNGGLTLTPAGSVVHALSDGDRSLNLAGLKAASVKELANDVTVTGAMEPTVYWNELFMGDGTTVEFDLAGQPNALAAGHAKLIDDQFNYESFNLGTWALTDPGSHLSLSGGGLTLTGGNGVDGQTTIAAIDSVEIAGTVVIELTGVRLGAASAGVLSGLYQGPTMQANCFAGWNVRQSGGNTVATPMVDGVETGTTLTLVSGHSYTLRLRFHCPEMQRVKQIYYAMVDGVVDQFGGGLVGAPCGLVFEAQDEGLASNTPVTVLYDGSVADAPAQATLVAANSVQLFGSVAAVRVTRTGSAWLKSTNPVTGTSWMRLAGTANEGVDCVVASGSIGKVTFLPGRVPAPNEVITVSYRGSDRSVARFADAASVAAEAAGGGVGTARWVGKVVRPAARSSADCEAAAQAVLSFATSRAAALSGSYVAVNPAAQGDVWPGDVLSLTSDGANVAVVARRIEIEERGATPEALTYKIGFANDWAEGLGLTLSEGVAKDALLPYVALELAPGTSAPVLGNLQAIALTSNVTANGDSLTVDAGTNPPAGGGFEVRRRDGGFGTGLAGGTGSGDLVLRSPVRGFSIPRVAFEETFYVRMYDASTPPLYSRNSSGIVTHLPIG